MNNNNTVGSLLSQTDHPARELTMRPFGLPFLSLLVCVLSLCFSVQSRATTPEQLYPAQHRADAPQLAKRGTFAVGVKTLEITHPDQLDVQNFSLSADRSLMLEVWYPLANSNEDANRVLAIYEDQTRLGKAFSLQGRAFRDAAMSAPQAENTSRFPLVVLSHGYTGYRSIMFYLGEHLASHGYVVAAIDHTDSTNKDINFAEAPHAGFVSTLRNRARDQQFVLDYFSRDSQQQTWAVDTNNAAIIGYSMGGFGALNTVGGCYDLSMSTLKAIGFPAPLALLAAPLLSSCSAGREAPDPRWKAMTAIAPWGQALDVHSPESLANITTPSLIIAGSEDDVSGYENGVKKIYEQLKGQNKYLLVYENARHNIAPHPAPLIAYSDDIDLEHYADPVWNTHTINLINQHMILAFLNCHVKSAQSDCNMLPNRLYATQKPQANGELTTAWPGFANRWGVGLQFHRKKQ